MQSDTRVAFAVVASALQLVVGARFEHQRQVACAESSKCCRLSQRQQRRPLKRIWSAARSETALQRAREWGGDVRRQRRWSAELPMAKWALPSVESATAANRSAEEAPEGPVPRHQTAVLARSKRHQQLCSPDATSSAGYIIIIAIGGISSSYNGNRAGSVEAAAAVLTASTSSFWSAVAGVDGRSEATAASIAVLVVVHGHRHRRAWCRYIVSGRSRLTWWRQSEPHDHYGT